MDCDINFLHELITYTITIPLSQVDHQTVVSVSRSSWNTCFGTGTLWHNFKDTIMVYLMWESIIIIVPQLYMWW